MTSIGPLSSRERFPSSRDGMIADETHHEAEVYAVYRYPKPEEIAVLREYRITYANAFGREPFGLHYLAFPHAQARVPVLFHNPD